MWNYSLNVALAREEQVLCWCQWSFVGFKVLSDRLKLYVTHGEIYILKFTFLEQSNDKPRHIKEKSYVLF